jgi:hypothetical protein
MFERIIGVFKLDVNTFEAVEHDQSATSQAAMIVSVVAVLSAFGSGLAARIGGGSFLYSFLYSFFSTLVWAFLGWFLWSLVSYLVGTMLFGGQATLDEMLRVIGFAHAPQILAIIPCIGGVVGAIWSLVAGFFAIRQGLDLDNVKAFLTVVVGFLIMAIGNVVINTVLSGVGSLLK